MNTNTWKSRKYIRQKARYSAIAWIYYEELIQLAIIQRRNRQHDAKQNRPST